MLVFCFSKGMDKTTTPWSWNFLDLVLTQAQKSWQQTPKEQTEAYTLGGNAYSHSERSAI